jgi:uncharacterized protein (DUF2147 family)
MRRLVLAALLALAPAAGRAASETLAGDFLVEDGLAKVAFGPCPAAPALTCGTITWLKDPVGHPTRDVNNPDRSLRGRPLIGLTVVRDMKPDGPGRWSGGRVYDPKTGRSGNGKLRLSADGKLRVEGCVLVICDSEDWVRAPD